MLPNTRTLYRLAGKESTFTLGEYPLLSLEQARAVRTEARELIKNGKNPALERRAKKQEEIARTEAARTASKNTFEFIALEWIGQQQERWSRDHATAVLASLKNNAFPVLGEIDVVQ